MTGIGNPRTQRSRTISEAASAVSIDPWFVKTDGGGPSGGLDVEGNSIVANTMPAI